MLKKQMLYYGPPGTGKTYQARERAIKIVNSNINGELENVNTLVEDGDINFNAINRAFEHFFEYDELTNESKSRFLNDVMYKPGKTCYRNMSALNKFMGIMIKRGHISISKEEWPNKGASTFAQYSRAVTNFDLAIEEKLEKNKKGVRLTQKGIIIKEEYEKLLEKDQDIDLNNLRILPDFAKQAILDSLNNTDEDNMSMWKSTIIGALWFICRRGYIYKYSKPKSITRTSEENDLLKICFGYDAKDNEFLSWVIPYLDDLGLVVEAESENPRYINKYYLSSVGKKLLKNMKIVSENIETENLDRNPNDIGSQNSIDSYEKIYKLKDEFIMKRNKLKEIFSRYRDNKENNIDMVTFHPSFEYENFIEGISVKSKDNKIEYYNRDGILKDISFRALRNLIRNNLCNQVESNEITKEYKDSILNDIVDWKTCYKKYRELESVLSWDYSDNFVLIIDEINRGDMSKVFGETITLLENDKRLGAHNEQVVKLPFTNDIFGIPKNIYILATMNTSDKSIANMDIALRRRFGFEKCKPNLDLVNDLYTFVPSKDDTRNLLDESVKAIKYINNKLSKISFIGSDKLIGHSYLMGMDVFKDENIVEIWKQDVIPLLEEYFLGEYDEMVDVISEKFVDINTCNFICEDMKELIGELSAKYE